jgi:hypothetical protein
MTEPPQPPKRLVLFIDNQNFYNGARRAFFNKDDPNYYGQFDPMKLGGLICARGVPGITRQLRYARYVVKLRILIDARKLVRKVEERIAPTAEA